MLLEGKRALVTGSTSGIGLAIARAFAAEGAAVMINGFGDKDEIKAICAELAEASGAPALHDKADLGKVDQVDKMIARCTSEIGSPDILVNNAGIQFVSPIADFPPEKWDAILAINLTAVFHTTRLALPEMRRRGWGRIINTASAHSLVASPQQERLCRRQAWRCRLHQGGRAGNRERRDHRQLHFAWLCLDDPGRKPDPRHDESQRAYTRSSDQ